MKYGIGIAWFGKDEFKIQNSVNCKCFRLSNSLLEN